MKGLLLLLVVVVALWGLTTVAADASAPDPDLLPFLNIHMVAHTYVLFSPLLLFFG
jgi:hypothetical protein